MKGDYSRFTFDPRKRYTGVRLQQGRVHLDADWNEQVDIQRDQVRCIARDAFGDGTPDADGFAVRVARSEDSGSTWPEVVVGAGRYFADGLRCFNEEELPVSSQPHGLGGSSRAPLPEGAAVLVHLEAWERHVTALEDPDLREPALGGLDTAARTQVVWQVRTTPIPDESDSAIRDVLEEGVPRARLMARHDPERAATTLDDTLYRVEIHEARHGEETFKWSRQNAIAARAIEEVEIDSTEDGAVGVVVVVQDLRSDGLPFEERQWVEISDERSELAGFVRPLCRVARVRPADEPGLVRVELEPTDGFDEEDLRQLSRGVLRRWDMPTDLERGVVPCNRGAWVEVENGISVNLEPEGGLFPGDSWVVPARSTLAGERGGVLWPTISRDDRQPEPRPPIEPRRARCPLALLSKRDGDWRVERDLRNVVLSLEALARSRVVDRSHRNEVRSDELTARLSELESLLGELPLGAGVLHCKGREDLAVGDVVAAVPGGEVERVTRSNASRVVGVVAGRMGGAEDPATYRIATHGVLRCRVSGPVSCGDLLVPAGRPGTVGRAGAYIEPGTLLGKATEDRLPGADGHEGLVRVVITLG